MFCNCCISLAVLHMYYHDLDSPGPSSAACMWTVATAACVPGPLLPAAHVMHRAARLAGRAWATRHVHAPSGRCREVCCRRRQHRVPALRSLVGAGAALLVTCFTALYMFSQGSKVVVLHCTEMPASLQPGGRGTAAGEQTGSQPVQLKRWVWLIHHLALFATLLCSCAAVLHPKSCKTVPSDWPM